MDQQRVGSDNGTDDSFLEKFGLLDKARWSFLRYLRWSLTDNGTSRGAVRSSDIRRFPFSLLDRYVLGQSDREQAQEYRKAVTAILVSGYVAFGMPELFDAFNTVMCVAMCYAAAVAAQGWFDTLWSRCLFPNYVGILVVCNAVHVWWLVRKML